MKKSIFNRLTTGLTALALVIAQVIMPAHAAFATKPDSNGMVSNNKVTVCHRTSSGSNPYVQQDIADDAAANREVNKVNGTIGVYPQADWGDIIPPFVYVHHEGGSEVSTHIPGLNWTVEGQAIYNNDCNIPGSATAVNGTFSDACGPAFNATFVETPTTGVTYHASTTGNTITVTATANAGYTLTNPNWSQTHTDQLVACQSDDKHATAVDGVFADKCGDTFNLTFTPAVTEGVDYHQSQTGNTITVTAAAKSGYVLDNPGWTQTATDQLAPCPTIKPCTTNTTSVVSKYEDFADYNDTRANGHTEFTTDGLHIYTDGNTDMGPRTDGVAGTWNTDKVAWYNALAPYSLADIGTPSIDYTNTAGGVPGMQIALDKDGDGIADGILVGEPASYGDNWWSNSSFGIASGMGYTSYGTLQDYLTANPKAQVIAVGFSLGSGVKGDGVLHSLTFGCQTWVFKKAPRVPTVCTLKDNTYTKPWTYDGEEYPFAGAWPENGVPATATFTDKGLHLTTPAEESYTLGFFDGNNTPLIDINPMSYRTMRDSSSTGYSGTLPAYILYVDTDGNAATDNSKYFFYEPYYNGTVLTDTWQDWNLTGSAKWYVSGTGQALKTWDQLLAMYPDATVAYYGFNQGTSNAGASTYIAYMQFDCATAAFAGGKGGVEEPETPTTPTTPTTPATPSTPVVGGKGSVVAPTTATELPETGAGTNALIIGLIAAAAAYGAVYFAQPKRLYE
jgi:hypothetical protein